MYITYVHVHMHTFLYTYIIYLLIHCGLVMGEYVCRHMPLGNVAVTRTYMYVTVGPAFPHLAIDWWERMISPTIAEITHSLTLAWPSLLLNLRAFETSILLHFMPTYMHRYMCMYMYMWWHVESDPKRGLFLSLSVEWQLLSAQLCMAWVGGMFTRNCQRRISVGLWAGRMSLA